MGGIWRCEPGAAAIRPFTFPRRFDSLAPMPYALHLEADLPPGLVAQQSRALADALRAAGTATTPAERAATAGERGGALELGKLVLEQIAGPVGKGLLDPLKAFLLRDRTVTVVLVKPDGSRVEITAKNVGSAEIAAVLDQAKSTLG